MRQALVQVGVRCRESLLLYHRGRAHAHAFIAINIFGILLALDGGWSQTFCWSTWLEGGVPEEENDTARLRPASPSWALLFVSMRASLFVLNMMNIIAAQGCSL